MKKVFGSLAVVLAVSSTATTAIAAQNSARNSPAVQQQWIQYESSSASASDKATYSAKTYLELPLMAQQSKSMVMPDFLMQSGTASQLFADGRMRYFFTGWQQLGDQWLSDYNYTPTVSSVIVNGNTATVVITPNATMTIPGLGTFSYPAAEHTITLQQDNNGHWVVTNDSYTDEFIQAFGKNPNWQSLIQSVPSAVAAEKAQPATVQKSNTTVTPNGLPGGPYLTYNRSTAVSYALAHTNNSNPTNGSTDTTNYNTALFATYSGNDCADFVSQCLYAGYGGQFSSTAVQGHYSPMVTNSTYNWYGDHAQDGSSMWINAYTLINDAVANGGNNSYVGPEMFSESTGSVSLGDVVLDSSNTGHVQIVTSVGSTPSWSNIAICSHTSNRDNVLETSLYGATKPSTVNFYGVGAYWY